MRVRTEACSTLDSSWMYHETSLSYDPYGNGGARAVRGKEGGKAYLSAGAMCQVKCNSRQREHTELTENAMQSKPAGKQRSAVPLLLRPPRVPVGPVPLESTQDQVWPFQPSPQESAMCNCLRDG